MRGEGERRALKFGSANGHTVRPSEMSLMLIRMKKIVFEVRMKMKYTV